MHTRDLRVNDVWDLTRLTTGPIDVSDWGERDDPGQTEHCWDVDDSTTDQKVCGWNLSERAR